MRDIDIAQSLNRKGMRKRGTSKVLSKFDFKVELESVYNLDREWRVSKCYQEVLGREQIFNRVLIRRKDGSIKVSKKA